MSPKVEESGRGKFTGDKNRCEVGNNLSKVAKERKSLPVIPLQPKFASKAHIKDITSHLLDPLQLNAHALGRSIRFSEVSLCFLPSISYPVSLQHPLNSAHRQTYSGSQVTMSWHFAVPCYKVAPHLPIPTHPCIA